MERELILERLKRRGGRITRQRELLIDIILNNEFTCCKEIYYEAAKLFPDIGMATVYRTVSVLEEIGALNKSCIWCMKEKKPVEAEECLVRLEDNTLIQLDAASLNRVIEKGLQESGLLNGKSVRTVQVNQGKT